MIGAYRPDQTDELPKGSNRPQIACPISTTCFYDGFREIGSGGSLREFPTGLFRCANPHKSPVMLYAQRATQKITVSL